MQQQNYKYNPEQVNYFAYTQQDGETVAFGIKAKDRLHHMYVVGKTGMGKSSLLENMAIQDILNDESIVFIDPHGNSAERLLKYVPSHRKEDVIYFNPQDLDYPTGFNVLENVNEKNKHILVSSIISIFKKIWSDAWSSRMEYILQNTLLALAEFDGATLLDINRMLVNKEFRKYVLSYVKDPVVKRFWEEEFESYTERYAQESTPAIQNKVGQFISNPLIRNIIGQKKSTFNLSQFIKNRQILILNLSKGAIGEDSAKLLGSLISIKLYLSLIKERQNAPNDETAHPIYLFVDEFHSISNDVFENMLSEARKYRLSITIAHQYLAQLDDKLRAAIFGNVGTNIAFRVGASDAEVLESIFAPNIDKDALQNLDFSEIALNLSIDGVTSPAFFAKTIPPVESAPYDFSDEIKELSRTKYAARKELVEDSILKSISIINNSDSDKQVSIATESKPKENKMHKASTDGAENKTSSNEELNKISSKIKRLMKADYGVNGSAKVSELMLSTNKSIKEVLSRIMKKQEKQAGKNGEKSAETKQEIFDKALKKASQDTVGQELDLQKGAAAAPNGFEAVENKDTGSEDLLDKKDEQGKEEKQFARNLETQNEKPENSTRKTEDSELAASYSAAPELKTRQNADTKSSEQTFDDFSGSADDIKNISGEKKFKQYSLEELGFTESDLKAAVEFEHDYELPDGIADSNAGPESIDSSTDSIAASQNSKDDFDTQEKIIPDNENNTKDEGVAPEGQSEKDKENKENKETKTENDELQKLLNDLLKSDFEINDDGASAKNN